MAWHSTLTVIEASSHPSLRQSLRELWAFREVMVAFAERSVRLKYKQAALGVAWAVIQPLAFLLVFVIIFGRIARVSGGGVPYPSFALAALIAWFFLQTSISLGAETLVRDGALVRKVFFPRETAILGTVLSATLDFGIGLVLFLIMSPFLGTQPTWTFAIAIPLLIPLALLAAGTALILGAFNVYYRDFRYALPLILQAWMLASPVAYPLSVVPSQWRIVYLILNPAVGILDSFRRTMAEGRLPDPTLMMISGLGASAIACAGYYVFKRMEPRFADAV